MSFEAVNDILEAEERAAAVIAEAEAEARRIRSNAELRSRAQRDAAAVKAESEIAELMSGCEAAADDYEKELRSAAETKIAVLIAKAERLIPRAADLITERIVNT